MERVNPNLLMVAGLVLLAGLGVLLVRSRGAGAVASGAAGAVVSAVDGLLSGTVVSIGKIFGLPETNSSRCAAAKAAGRWFDASLVCSVPDLFSPGNMSDVNSGFSSTADALTSPGWYAVDPELSQISSIQGA